MRGLLVGILLLTCCFSAAVLLEPRMSATPFYARHEQDPVGVILGESRRLFAGYFLTKADVYFHSGYYPSIFDNVSEVDRHVATGTGVVEEKKEGTSTFGGKPLDIVDRFGRSFFPSSHTHLDSPAKGHKCDDPSHDHDHEGHDDHDNDEDEAEASQDGNIRELLPWLRITAGLDPNRIETYTVGAYWLRTRMKKTSEAEAFLRDGLRVNPGNYAILFELGRIYHENHNDSDRARNILEHALKRWNQQESTKDDPDTFLLSQITWQLALIEIETKNLAQAISYLETAKQVSPKPEEVQKRIDELKSGERI